MDPELKAYLDTRFAETQKAIDAMDGKIDETRVALEARIDETRVALEAMDGKIDETRVALEARIDETSVALEAMDGKIDETRVALEARIDETSAALEAKIDETRREAGVMFESILHEIKVLPEGLSTFQRLEANCLDAEREEAMLNRHVLPLEASAANHEKRIKAVEKKAR